MHRHAHGRLHQQVVSLRQQFLQQDGLPFADVLSWSGLEAALREVRPGWKDRIFTPLITLWVFLGQVLNADQSCRAAVARLIAHRASQGLAPCSSETGAYCQARGRLPERFFAAVARLVGRNLDERVDRRWLWKGRRVCLFDGSTVSMPDTEENRREYPLTYNQVPGTSFAPARIGAIISLSCGAILDLGICRYAGKGQGEVSLLRRLWDTLRPGDVLLGDRLMSGWVGMHLLKGRGVDTVSRLRRTAGPTSARGRVWARTTISSSGGSRRRSARWTGGRITRYPTPSPSARCDSGWRRPGSGRGGSWS